MASGYADANFHTRNIRAFIDDVEKGTDGALEITLNSNDTLIKLDAIKRAVQAGQIPIGEIRLGVYGNEDPMYILAGLPFIAPDYATAWLLKDLQKPYFDAQFEKNGMKILYYAPWPGQGFYTKFPVNETADFKGKNLRIYSTATRKMGEMLGFNATLLPFAEIPQAFSTGLIEALFTSPQTGIDIQAWDNTSNFTYAGAILSKSCVVVNLKAWNRLDADTRAGMGRCQGRYCGAALARACAESAERRGSGPDERGWFTPRFPVKPVPAAALAKEAPELREQDQGMPPPRTEPPAFRSRAAGAGEEAEVAVIGAGIVGSCVAYYLAREGVDVVVLERGRRNCAASGNNAGSLHVQLLAYDFGDWAQAGGGPAANTLPLQRDSAAIWPKLAAALGADLDIEITGGLMLAEDPRRLKHLKRKAALERRHGVEVEILSAIELRELAPYVSPRMAGAAWCPAEGKINPLLAAPAVLEGALAAGARLRERAEVHAVARTGSGFEVRTARGPVRAGKVLNASGGWSARVAEMVGRALARPRPPNPAHRHRARSSPRSPPAGPRRPASHPQAGAQREPHHRRGLACCAGRGHGASDGVARLLRGKPLGRVTGAARARHHARHPLVGGDERRDRRRAASRRASRRPGLLPCRHRERHDPGAAPRPAHGRVDAHRTGAAGHRILHPRPVPLRRGAAQPGRTPAVTPFPNVQPEAGPAARRARSQPATRPATRVRTGTLEIPARVLEQGVDLDVREGFGRPAHAVVHGSTTSMSRASKSRTLRVATAMSRERAMAAIWQSAGAMGRPVERRAAAMSA